MSFPVSSLEVVSGKTEPSLAAFERRPTFLPDTSLPKSVIITRVGEADATGFCPALQSNQVRRAGFAGLAAHAHVPQAHPQASNSCGHTSSLRPSPCCPRVQSPAVAVTQLQESSRGKRVACSQHPGRGCVLGDLSEAQAAAKSQEVDLGRSCSPGSLAFSMPVTVVGPGDHLFGPSSSIHKLKGSPYYNSLDLESCTPADLCLKATSSALNILFRQLPPWLPLHHWTRSTS